MTHGDGQADSIPSVHNSFVFLMARFVYPLEEANDEAESGCDESHDHIEDGYFELAVETVIESWESTTWDQNVDTCVVETIGDGVGSLY